MQLFTPALNVTESNAPVSSFLVFPMQHVFRLRFFVVSFAAVSAVPFACTLCGIVSPSVSLCAASHRVSIARPAGVCGIPEKFARA